MRTIIAGGRDFSPTPADSEWLDSINAIRPITVVLSGASRGADEFGERWARDRDTPVEQYFAKWSEYGPSAGPIRNREMAENADACILFPGGKGTAHMEKIARALGLEVIIREAQ